MAVGVWLKLLRQLWVVIDPFTCMWSMWWFAEQRGLVPATHMSHEVALAWMLPQQVTPHVHTHTHTPHPTPTHLVVVLCAGKLQASSTTCPAAPGAQRAACFCASVSTYKMYANALNGCTGALWCINSASSSYIACPTGTLFNEAVQVCDWPANVNCPGSGSPNSTGVLLRSPYWSAQIRFLN